MSTLLYPFEHDRCIGTVTQVAASSVRANLPKATANGSRLLHGHRMGAGEVGEFVVIECDEIAVFGRILEVRLPERERLAVEPKLGKTDDVHPVGVIQLLATIDLAISEGTPGISRYPRLGSRVFSAHPDLIRWIITDAGHREDVNCGVELEIACITDDHSVSLAITPEQLLGRHCAILGTTGGGKSWTVARIIEEASECNSKVILLDATGEYSTLESDHVMHASIGEGECSPDSALQVSFPHSDLVEHDLFALFRPSGQSQGPKLRAAIRSLRLLKCEPSLAQDNGTLLKALQPREPIESALAKHAGYVECHRSEFDAAPLSRQIREECVWPTASRNDYTRFGDYSPEEGYCLTLIMRVESIVTSGDYACVFAAGEHPTTAQVIDEFLSDDDARVLRISLQNVPFGNHAREVVANAIGRLLLDKARKEGFRERPLVVFLDEAHQFLNRTIGDEHLKVELDAFGLIAKEGRKYGLTIGIATQRPRDIPQDVLSQMGTLVVHRLINERDRDVVERAAGDIDRSVAAFLPTLGPGQAVVVGVDIPVPMAIQVRPPSAKPNSGGPDYQVRWAHPLVLNDEALPCLKTGIESFRVWDDTDYELPNGEVASGPACEVEMNDGRTPVLGKGAVVQTGNCRWKVESVDLDQETITLHRT